MPKTFICFNDVHHQTGAAIFEEDLAATKQSFAFVRHGGHRKDVQGKSSEIGLALVAVLPVFNDVEILVLLEGDSIGVKVFGKSINW